MGIKVLQSEHPIGKRINSFTVIKHLERKFDRHWCILKCDCGTEVKYSYTDIKIALKKEKLKKCQSCLRIGQSRLDLQLENFQAEKNYLFRRYKIGAKERQLEFILTKTEFEQIIQQNCTYCGQIPSRPQTFKIDKNLTFFYNGVDRINSNEGYTNKNCVPCCTTCNQAKSTKSKKDFLDWILKVAKHSNLI